MCRQAFIQNFFTPRGVTPRGGGVLYIPPPMGVFGNGGGVVVQMGGTPQWGGAGGK